MAETVAIRSPLLSRPMLHLVGGLILAEAILAVAYLR
jgi:hypothetical protein